MCSEERRQALRDQGGPRRGRRGGDGDGGEPLEGWKGGREGGSCDVQDSQRRLHAKLVSHRAMPSHDAKPYAACARTTHMPAHPQCHPMIPIPSHAIGHGIYDGGQSDRK